jgi:hypothetical protein
MDGIVEIGLENPLSNLCILVAISPSAERLPPSLYAVNLHADSQRSFFYFAEEQRRCLSPVGGQLGLGDGESFVVRKGKGGEGGDGRGRNGGSGEVEEGFDFRLRGLVVVNSGGGGHDGIEGWP